MIAELLLSATLIANLAARVQPPAPPVVSQPAPAVPSLERQFFKNLLRDQRAIWTSPRHVRGHDLAWIAPFSVGTAVFFAADRRIGDNVTDQIVTHPGLFPASRGISEAGTGYAVSAAAVAFYVIGRATHNPHARETGVLTAEALLDSAIVGGVIKSLTQRGRPDSGDHRSEFFTKGSSFPSGHALGIWSAATVIAQEYSDHRWVQLVAYGMAGAVSVSRVTARRHYPSDVLVGSAMGYLIGRYVYRAHHVETAPSSHRLPFVSVELSRQTQTYAVALRWVY